MADPARGYDQVIAYGDLAADPLGGSGRVDIQVLGPFNVVFPSGYRPQAGDDFRLLFAHEFDPLNGEFDADFWPGVSVVPAAQFQYLPKFMTDLTALVNSLPALGAGLSYQPYLHEDAFGITVVPEPGTLALLITGAFGLLLLVWRRRRS